MSNEDNNVSEVMETPTTIESTNANVSKKRNKLVPVIIVLLVALVILGGGFYYYFSRPSAVVTSMINKAYDKFSNALHKADEFDYKKDTIRVSGDLNIDTNIDGLEDLKKETFNYTFGMDVSNKKLEIGGALKEGKTSIVDVIAYILDDKAYISLKDDYDKLISVDAEDADIDLDDLWNLKDTDLSIDDIDYIVKEFKDILIDSIDMDELEKSSDKITYNLNKKNTKNLVKNIIENTLNNNDLLKKISELTDTDVSDLKDGLKEAKKNLDDIEAIGKLNIYTSGITNKVVKVELVVDGGKIGYAVNDNNTEIYARGNGMDITFTIKENTDEKFDMDYLIKVDSNKISGNMTATSKEVKKNNYEGSISFSLKYDDYKFNIKSNYKTEYGAKIADVNTSKAVDVNKADAKLEKALKDIIKRVEDSSLYDLIEALPTSYFTSHSSSSYDYNDDDYDYDYDDYDDYDNDDDDDDFDFDWDD